MKNRLFIVAFALIVLVNGLVLAGVAYNRSGEPEARLTLTERELSLNSAYSSDENTGLAMVLDWNQYGEQSDWFDAEKLQDVGFDVDEISREERNWRYMDGQLPRKGYVVLELGGAPWQAWQADKNEEIRALQGQAAKDDQERKRLERQIEWIRVDLQSQSRLFAVDAGGDPETLRQRYADRSRYVIVAAEIRIRATRVKDQPQRLFGSIRTLLTDRLHVPLALQEPLAKLPDRPYRSRYDDDSEVPQWQPYYTVQVRWGRRYEPWIEVIELTSAGEAAAGKKAPTGD